MQVQRVNGERMSEGSRWWEFYFVRYAIGTLTGALFVNQIARISPELGRAVFFGIDPMREVAFGIPLVLGYGLLFCYVASIPVLVLHSARLIRPKILSMSPMSGAQIKDVIAVAAIAALGIALLAAIRILPGKLADQSFLIQVGIYSILGMLWLEWAALAWLLAHLEQAFKALEKLARARERNRNAGGLIDSYRHLREHGNSIFIVLLELILGGVLLGILHLIVNDQSVPSGEKVQVFLRYTAPVVLLWMLPGAIVWRVSTSFERRFADAYGE